MGEEKTTTVNDPNQTRAAYHVGEVDEIGEGPARVLAADASRLLEQRRESDRRSGRRRLVRVAGERAAGRVVELDLPRHGQASSMGPI